MLTAPILIISAVAALTQPKNLKETEAEAEAGTSSKSEASKTTEATESVTSPTNSTDEVNFASST